LNNFKNLGGSMRNLLTEQAITGTSYTKRQSTGNVFLPESEEGVLIMAGGDKIVVIVHSSLIKKSLSIF
jgi:hypothetical protein